jgi:Na+/proline symporter
MKASLFGLLLVCVFCNGFVEGASCPKGRTITVDGKTVGSTNNAKFKGSCQVYKRGESPCKSDSAPLDEVVGWLVVIGFGALFTLITIILSRYEYKALGTAQSSEQFNTAGRNVGPGMTAAVIVSQWTWAATLLMSSNMGWRVGVSGPFWYASGATVQILLFAVLAIQVKRRCSHMHTFMEIVKVRFGTTTHVVMMCFALTTNIIVTSMLLLGGAATIEDLTGMSKLTAAFLIPILSCWLYTMYGGLRATFIASYVHTTVIFLMLIIFTFTVYAGDGKEGLWGSPSKVHNALEKASRHGFFNATFSNTDVLAQRNNGPFAYFSDMQSIMQNDGKCYTSTGIPTDKSCGFSERGKDKPCCTGIQWDKDGLPEGTYCRSDYADCITTSAEKHFDTKDCNFAAGERCVTSFLTMGSTIGLIFGITNIVGNFGTVFVDQSYWQSAVAAKPKSAVIGFLIGGMVWFAVPFCMATTNGLAGRALTTMTSIDGKIGAKYITAGDSGAGLTPARVLSEVLGPFGAFILLLQLFMAITSTGSAEIIAVSSILTYDIYYEYINPELKSRREKLRRIFYTVVQRFTGGQKVDLVKTPAEALRVRLEQNPLRIPLSTIQAIMDALVAEGFFEIQPTSAEVETLSIQADAASANGELTVEDLYNCVNKAVASNNIEGAILLRVSKFCTGLFAIFMGFLAVFLLTIGMNLGQVYMSMGCVVGSAVGPAALTILMERANGRAVAAGAVGGLILAMLGWTLRAQAEFGAVKYETMMQDWPWVVGNLCAILGGLLIAVVGSLIWPDNDFKWAMLNDRIPLVDDVEPPKDAAAETDSKLGAQVKIAIGASVLLTLVLLVLWPIPMHLGSGVFSESGFTVWVILEFVWAIVGGLVIILLPGYELVRGFMGMDRIKAKGDTKIQVDLNKKKEDPPVEVATPMDEI